MMYYTWLATPIGKIFISKTDEGIDLITWQKGKWNDYYRNNKSNLKQEAKKFEAFVNKMKRYFSGKEVCFDEKMDIGRYSPLEKSIWKKIQEIPYGQTRSYKWLACKVGNSKLARVVGNACAKNPFPIIVPCHRVVKSDGGLGGFAGGLKRKTILLRIERAVKTC